MGSCFLLSEFHQQVVLGLRSWNIIQVLRMICKMILIVENLVVKYSLDVLGRINSATVRELLYHEIKESKMFSVVGFHNRLNYF